MGRFNFTKTTLITADTNTVNSTLLVLPTVIDCSQGIGGRLYTRFKLTAASASQKLDVYGFFSDDNSIFDDYSIINSPLLTTITVINALATYSYYSQAITDDKITARYMKLGLLPSSAAAGTLEANSTFFTLKVPK